MTLRFPGLYRLSATHVCEGKAAASRGLGFRSLGLGIAVALGCLGGAPASLRAQEVDDVDKNEKTEKVANRRGDREDGFYGFMPYFNSGPYTTIQRVKGTISTTFGPFDSPRNTLTNMGWLFELGVSSPKIELLPGDPRLNIFGGILIPTNESSVIGSQVSIEALGQDTLTENTKMQLEYQTSYRAGMGMEFDVEFFEVDLKLMPGVQYLYLGSRYAAQVDSTLVPGNFLLPNETRISSAKNALAQHFLGPSLKITTEHVDVWRFRVDLYIEGSLLFDVAGTREQSRFVDTDGETSIFTWEADTTAGVFNAGLRIRLF